MSVVKSATRRSSGRRVALKCIRTRDEEIRQFTRDEFELVRSLNHPGIIRFEALYESEFKIRICMEFCSDGSVESFVRERGAFREAGARTLFWQLLRGVNYLHHKRVVHRDLKPANLLLQKDAAVLKITDFNSSKRIGKHLDSSSMLTDRGTRQYSAPELRFGHFWNERIDIWACGLCKYFMLRGKIPFNSEDPQAAKLLRAGRLPDVDWDGITDPMGNLIGQCLTIDMVDRPPAMELVLHPVFQMSPTACGGGRLRLRRQSDDTTFGRRTAEAPRDMFWLLPSCGLTPLCSAGGCQAVPPELPVQKQFDRSGPATMYLPTPTGTPKVSCEEFEASLWQSSYSALKQPRRFDMLLQLAENKYKQMVLPRT